MFAGGMFYSRRIRPRRLSSRSTIEEKEEKIMLA
jgi:hypothetical protein